MTIQRFSVTSSLFAAAALLAVGCGSYGDMCERAAQCRGGASDTDIDACVIELEQKEEIASLYECDDAWDNYVSCIDEHGVCDGDKLSGCDPQKDSYKQCIDNRSAGDVKVDLRQAP